MAQEKIEIWLQVRYEEKRRYNELNTTSIDLTQDFLSVLKEPETGKNTTNNNTKIDRDKQSIELFACH